MQKNEVVEEDANEKTGRRRRRKTCGMAKKLKFSESKYKWS